MLPNGTNLLDRLTTKAEELNRAEAEYQRTCRQAEEILKQNSELKARIHKADELAANYLCQVSTVTVCLGASQTARQALQEANERLERAKVEAILTETPTEKGGPGRINGGNAEARALQTAQVLDCDPHFQNCKAEVEACQREADRANMERDSAMMKLSAYKAVVQLYTSELAALVEV